VPQLCWRGHPSSVDVRAISAAQIVQHHPVFLRDEPEVELGVRSESGYQALGNDASVQVIFGTQGGTWIMPVLRVRGVAASMQVAGTLVLATGEVLGASDLAMSLDNREGWLESERFAIPVQHAPPREFDSIADVYGQSAEVTVQATDEAGRFADHEVRVVLTE